jgi:hypothetical protein
VSTNLSHKILGRFKNVILFIFAAIKLERIFGCLLLQNDLDDFIFALHNFCDFWITGSCCFLKLKLNWRFSFSPSPLDPLAGPSPSSHFSLPRPLGEQKLLDMSPWLTSQRGPSHAKCRPCPRFANRRPQNPSLFLFPISIGVLPAAHRGIYPRW